MEWLILGLVLLVFLTVLGHGIWVLLALIFRTLFQTMTGEPTVSKADAAFCSHCGSRLPAGRTWCDRCGRQRPVVQSAELGDLEAVERQLRRWRERGELKARLANRMLSHVQFYRGKLLEPKVAPARSAPSLAPASFAPRERATTIAASEHRNPAPADEPTIVASVVEPTKTGSISAWAESKKPAVLAPATYAPAPAAPPQTRPAPTPRVPQPAAPPSAPPAPPSPPPPRRTLAEMLAAFMEQRNIRWGELVGGLLIVCSSIALVISLWDTLNTIPYFQFLIFVGVSAAVFGAGLYTEHRWKLESTSRGILIIATLLVPLNFVAMAATARAGWDAIALLAELISLGLFVALVERAGRVLTPRWRWPLTIAVVGNSGLLLLARHHLPLVWLTVAGSLAVVCHAGSIGAALVSLHREMLKGGSGGEGSPQANGNRFGAERAGELFVLLGAACFALVAALGFLAASSHDRMAALHWFSPLVGLVAPPVCAAGIAVMRGLKEEQELAGWRTAGTAVALFGGLAMIAAQALAWPLPAAMIVVGALNFAGLSLVGSRGRLPAAHAAAILSLAMVYLTGVHLALGHLAAAPHELLARTMIALALDQQTGVLLIGLFVVLVVVCVALIRRGKTLAGVYYAAGGAATAVVSLSNLLAHAYLIGDANRWIVLGSCCTYGLASLLANLRWRRPALSYLGSALLAVGLLDVGFLRPAVALDCPWLTACLAHATMAMAIGLASGRYLRFAGSKVDGALAQPLLKTAAISSAASLAALLWLGQQPSLALSLHLVWLAALWLVLAIRRRSTAWFAAFQSALTAATLAAVTAWLRDQPWIQQGATFLLDPRSLQAYGIGLGALCAAWSAARIVLRRSRAAAMFLEDVATPLEHWTFYLLSLATLAVVAWNALPGAISEISTGGVVALPFAAGSIAFGPLAWLLVATQAFALLIALWDRWRGQEMACCLLLLYTAAVTAAGPSAGSLAVASALRWSLSGAFLLGSALVWLRRPLGRATQTLSCRCKLAAHDLKLAQRLLLALGAMPVLLITGMVVAMQIAGLRPAGPMAGSWFANLGFNISYLIPLAIIAATLLGHALREASPGYAFSAGLVTELTVGGGYALSVQQFGAGEFVAMVQLATTAAALWAIGWLASRRKLLAWSGRAEPPSERRFLQLQLGLPKLGNVLLILPALGSLALISPPALGAARSWIAAAGSPLGWLAFVAAVGAGRLAAWRERRRLRPEMAGLVGLAALGLGACSIAWAGAAEVWAYRALMLGWALYAVSVVAAAWQVSSRFARESNAAMRDSLVRSAALWVRVAGLLALGLGVKTALFDDNEQLWAASAIALASAACAAMAVWLRREGWAFIAGLGVNLAASIAVWHWEFAQNARFADVWLQLLEANLIAGAAVALVWLFSHQRFYSDRLLSPSAAPLLSLQVTLLALGNLLALGIPLMELVLQPGEIAAGLLQAGGRSGWLAWSLGGAAIGLYLQRIARRELPYLLTTFLLGVGVLAAGAAADWSGEPWLPYHALQIAWVAAGFLILAAALFAAPRIAWLKSLGRGETAVALLTTIETLAAVLALRGAWDDPGRPYWSAGAALIASLLAAMVAIVFRKPDHRYASAALIHLAIVLAGVASADSPAVEYWLIHLIALGVQSIAWSIWDRLVGSEHGIERESSWPPIHLAAASLAVGLFSMTAVCNLLRAAGLIPAGLPMLALFDLQVASDSAPRHVFSSLAWTGWGAATVAVVLTLQDVRARFRLLGLYAIGLAGVVLTVERNTASPLHLAEALVLGVAAYLFGVALLGRFAARFKALLTNLQAASHNDTTWYAPTQCLLTMLVASLSLWLVLNGQLSFDRLPGSLATALLLAAALVEAGGADRQWRSAWRFIACGFAVLAAAELGWTWLAGEGPIFWLQRQVILASAIFAGVLAAQFALPKLAPQAGEWIESGRRASITCGAALMPLLATVLMQEWNLRVPREGVPMGAAAVAAMAAMLAGSAALALLYAISPRRDPLRLSLRGRQAYVYAAELLALFVVVHIRTAVPKLIPIGMLDKYWTLIVMVVAFVGAGLSEFFERRRLNVLSAPLARTALLAPLIPAFGHWLRPALYVDAEPVLLLVATFYGLQATLKRSWTLAGLAIVSGNAALWMLWHRLGIDFRHHPQLWLIPISLVALVAEHIQRGRLSSQQAGAIRYFALAVIYVSSTVDVFVSHQGRDLNMALVFVLMGLSVTGVLAGILLQVRSFLYLGVTFLLVDLSIVVFHAAWDRGHMWVFWLAGIAVGAGIIALFAVFEKHRNDLAPALDRFKQWN